MSVLRQKLRLAISGVLMHSLLDECGCRWFLQGVLYADLELHVVLAEAIVSDEQSSIVVSGRKFTSPGMRAVDVTEKSRRFEVIFKDVQAYQVIDEGYT